MGKYSLYRVDFMIPRQGYIYSLSLEIITSGPREAIAKARQLVFSETGVHACRCKAKLVSL